MLYMVKISKLEVNICKYFLKVKSPISKHCVHSVTSNSSLCWNQSGPITHFKLDSGLNMYERIWEVSISSKEHLSLFYSFNQGSVLNWELLLNPITQQESETNCEIPKDSASMKYSQTPGWLTIPMLPNFIITGKNTVYIHNQVGEWYFLYMPTRGKFHKHTNRKPVIFSTV